MPHLVLAGLPTPLVQRISAVIKAGVSLRNGWTREFVPSKDTREPKITTNQASDVMRRASTYPDSHIIGVSKAAGNARQEVGTIIRRNFRFRWLDNNELALITSNCEEFIVHLNEVLEEEELWANTIKPSELVSPLLLPQGCFRVSQAYADLWERSEGYGNRAIMRAFSKDLTDFVRVYYKRLPGENGAHVRWWTDDNDLSFRHRGPKHGTAPFPRNWKYSYELVDGFHYDVTNLKGQSFTVRDVNGAPYNKPANGNVNLDPHGYVRTSANS